MVAAYTSVNIKDLTIYTQEERKFYFSCHIWHFMCDVGLKCPQDHCLSDWMRCVVSLSFLFSDTLYSININSLRSYYRKIFLLAWYVSCACEFFSFNLIVFAINNFHKQLYEKIVKCLVEADIWEITVRSTCWKKSEYFDKRYIARFLTCNIYSGAFSDNSLRLDPTNSYHHKELHRRLGRVPKVHLFH